MRNKILCSTSQNVARVEAAYTGIRCNRIEGFYYGRMEDCPRDLWLSVSGSAADLIRHGFLTEDMIELLPPSGGARFTVRDAAKFDAKVIPASVRRNRNGFRVERRLEGTDVETFLQRTCMAAEMERAIDELEGRRVGAVLRRGADAATPRVRSIGRQQRMVRWTTAGNMITVDWSALRRERATAFA